MKIFIRVARLFLIAALYWVHGPATAQAKIERLDMFVGEVRVLEKISVDRIAVGKGDLLRVRILPKSQLLLIAEGEGSTSLHLWHKDGKESDINIRVSKSDPEVRVRLEDMIYMDVKIVEFRKTALRELGISWQSSMTGPALATAGDFQTSNLFPGPNRTGIFSALPNNVKPFQTYFGITSQLSSTINFLAQNGDAYTLAEPKLSARNGGTAEFLAGGEVPIPFRGSDGEVTVEYKEYGISLKVTPRADKSGVIAAEIETEVSSLDQSVTVLGVPGLLTRRTKTEMNVHEAETIVISGLMNANSGKDVEKLPLLGDIPILGHLFKSTNFRNERTELVVFVTPRIIKADSELNKRQIDKARKFRQKALTRNERYLKFGIVD